MLFERHGGEDDGGKSFGAHDGNQRGVAHRCFAVQSEPDGRNSQEEDERGERQGNVHEVDVGELDGNTDVDEEEGLEQEDHFAEEVAFLQIERDGFVREIASHPGQAVKDFDVAEHRTEDHGGDIAAESEDFDDAEQDEDEGRGGEDGIFETSDAHQDGGPEECAGCARDSGQQDGGDKLTDDLGDVKLSKTKAIHDADGEDNAEYVAKGGLDEDDGLRRRIHDEAARERDDDGRGRGSDDCAEHEAEAHGQPDKVVGSDPDGKESDDEVNAGEQQNGTDGVFEDVEIEAEAGFKQDNDESDGGEDGADAAEVDGRDKVENGSEDDADDGEEEDVRNAGAAEDAGEQMCSEDQSTDYQDVGGYVHRIRNLPDARTSLAFLREFVDCETNVRGFCCKIIFRLVNEIAGQRRFPCQRQGVFTWRQFTTFPRSV